MKSVRILHWGDLHLGSAFAGLGRKGAERKKELLQTFRGVVRLCREQRIQVMLVAGDLFDHVKIAEETLTLVRDEFASLADTVVAIAPGNHDPLTIDSPYGRENFWPENVHIFGPEFGCREYPALGARIWGAGFSGAYQHDSPLVLPGPVKDDRINLCVLHGTVVPGRQESEYGPITEEQLRESGMDYIALGHLHKPTDIRRAGRSFYAYSGCPEGRGFDEQGERGVYLGDVSQGLCDLQFQSTQRRMYAELPVDLSAVERGGAGRAVRRQMEERYGEGYAENLYRVVLRGEVRDEGVVNEEALAAELADVFYLQIRDETSLLVEEPGSGGDYTLRGIFTRRILQKIEAEREPDDLQLALKLGLRALSEKVNYHED